MSMIGSMYDRHGKTALIQTPTRTETGVVSVDTWSEGTTIVCIFTSATGGDIERAMKMGREVSHVMYCDYMTISEKDRVVIDGKYYFVQLVTDPQNSNAFLKVLLKGGDNFVSGSQQ